MDSALNPAPKVKKRRRLWVWLAIAAVLAIGGYLFLQHLGPAHPATTTAATEPPGAPVSVATARTGDIGVYVEALGSVTPVNTVSLTSRVQGEIMEVHYTEGQLVKKNDPLVVIDPRPFEAQLTQIQGQLAHDQALLNEARIDLDRYQAAFSKNAIAKQQVDDQQQVVFQDEGTVKNDQGQLQTVEVNLAYCHLKSPIDGRVGLRLVDPGNVVQANGTNPLVMITQLQPITVIFSVAEDYLPQIQAQIRKGQRLVVDAFDRTQEKKITSGYLLTTDNQIDTTTGTVKLRAVFPNTDDALFPSQFVNARLLVETQHNAVLVPTAAVQRNAQSAFVYAVGADQKAMVRNITVGTTDGNVAAVQGLKAGEVVVTNGFDKLQDGVKVAVSSNPQAPAGNNPTTNGSNPGANGTNNTSQNPKTSAANPNNANRGTNGR